MPIAWVDEIAGLEPAINYLRGNGFSSQLWEYKGSEKMLLAYLPLQGWLHIVCQSVLDYSMYLVRLPYALYLLGGALFLYFGLKHNKITPLTSLVLVVLMLNEKSLFETTRAIRVEPISFLLICMTHYAYSKNKFHLAAIACSLMIVLHPNLWPIALVMFLASCWQLNINQPTPLAKLLRLNLLWIYPIGILVFYLFFIHFDVELLYNQFGEQAVKHDNEGSLFARTYNHFIVRFWPYNFTQPYTPFVVYLACIVSAISIFKRKARAMDFTVILTHIVWIAVVGPMHRYNSVLVLISIFSLVPYIHGLNTKISSFWKYALFIILLSISCVDIVARQTMAIAQRQERNPKHMLAWLNKSIPNTKSIITGSEIAYYHTAYNTNVDFFLYNTTPYKFDFSEYQNLLILAPNTLHGFEVIDHYVVEKPCTWSWIKNSTTKTYNDTYLLRAKNIDVYTETLVLLKAKNTQEVNRLRNR